MNTTSACDAFVYDENKDMLIKDFFRKYRDKFPMLAIMIDGICGETSFDCYDCYQVFRIHGYTSQPRVVAIDSSEGHMQRYNYITIPVKTHMKFKVVKSHRSEGAAQSLEEVLSENELPVLVKMGEEDLGYTINARLHGKCMTNVRQLLITKRYDEHYIMMNCIDLSDLKMTKQHCLVTMTSELTAATIEGFKHQSDVEFKAYLEYLDEFAATSGEVYDTSQGNPDMDICSLEHQEIDPQLVTTKTDIFPDIYEHPPPIPRRQGDGNEPDDDSDGIYDEISPYVPPRKPIGKTAGATAQTAAPKAKKKGIFKKWGGKKQQKNKEEVDNANRDTTSKTTTKTVNVDDRKPIPVPVKPIGDSDIYYGECEVNNSYEELEEHNVETGNLTYTPLEAKKSSECTIAPSDVFAEKMSMPLNMSHLKRNDPLQTKSLSGKGTSNEETFKKPEASIIHGRGSVQNKYVRMAYGSGKVEPIKKMEKALNKPPYDNTKFHDGRGGTDTDGQGKAQTGPSNQPSEPLSVHETQSAAGNRLSVADMTMHELGSSLQKLKLDKYVAILEEQMIDGSLLKELSIEDFVNELGLTKVEAIRLNKFANTGHIPR